MRDGGLGQRAQQCAPHPRSLVDRREPVKFHLTVSGVEPLEAGFDRRSDQFSMRVLRLVREGESSSSQSHAEERQWPLLVRDLLSDELRHALLVREGRKRDTPDGIEVGSRAFLMRLRTCSSVSGFDRAAASTVACSMPPWPPPAERLDTCP